MLGMYLCIVLIWVVLPLLPRGLTADVAVRLNLSVAGTPLKAVPSGSLNHAPVLSEKSAVVLFGEMMVLDWHSWKPLGRPRAPQYRLRARVCDRNELLFPLPTARGLIQLVVGGGSSSTVRRGAPVGGRGRVSASPLPPTLGSRS